MQVSPSSAAVEDPAAIPHLGLGQAGTLVGLVAANSVGTEDLDVREVLPANGAQIPYVLAPVDVRA